MSIHPLNPTCDERTEVIFSENIDPILVEPDSWIRGAIPIMSIPLASTCFLFNVFLPGSGTILSGIAALFCLGYPRFSTKTTAEARIGSFLLNFFVGILQLFTVICCLVGFCWSIGWGITFIVLAKDNKAYLEGRKQKLDQANQPEQTSPFSEISLNSNYGISEDSDRSQISFNEKSQRYFPMQGQSAS